MIYATPSEFEVFFGPEEARDLSAPDGRRGEVADVSVLTFALERASTVIDGYLLGAGYSLPFSAPPLLLNRLCLDIARYILDLNLEREDVRKRYEDAIRDCDKISRGLIVLDVPSAGSGGLSAASSWSQSPRAGPGRDAVFTPESLSGYGL